MHRDVRRDLEQGVGVVEDDLHARLDEIVGEMLGRARIRTDDPAERIDHKVLETLIELESSARLPIGLRVDAFITRVN